MGLLVRGVETFTGVLHFVWVALAFHGLAQGTHPIPSNDSVLPRHATHPECVPFGT